MIKILLLLALSLLLPLSIQAKTPDKTNSILFGEKRNQLSVYYGASINTCGLENLHFLSLTYSQPNSFLRLDGRLNVEFAGFLGGGGNLKGFTTPIFGLSQDIAFPLYKGKIKLYIGLNLGIYIKAIKDSRIGSQFSFGERVFLGSSFDRYNVEVFIRHFSNGSLAFPNIGENFFGLSFAFNY